MKWLAFNLVELKQITSQHTRGGRLNFSVAAAKARACLLGLGNLAVWLRFCSFVASGAGIHTHGCLGCWLIKLKSHPVGCHQSSAHAVYVVKHGQVVVRESIVDALICDGIMIYASEVKVILMINHIVLYNVQPYYIPTIPTYLPTYVVCVYVWYKL